MSLDQALNRFLPQIDAELRRLMAVSEGEIDDFYGMLHYHLGWVDRHLTPTEFSPGKRLRPIFTLICCQTAGGDPARAMTAAATVELIHNFSLIHDDIEDRSDTRRGRSTVWAIWGEPQAINAGDALFVLARNALLRLREQGVPAETILAGTERLDQTCLQLCRGQFLDMRFEQTESVSLAAYLEMITGKTSALLACAGYLGGLIAGDDPAQAQPYWDLGLSLGLAFQIQDDFLGVWGEEELTGKGTADDLRRRKKSLPVVYALNHDAPEAEEFRALYRRPALSEADIDTAIHLLNKTGAKTYTQDLAQQYVDEAKAALSAINAPAEAKTALQELAQFFIQRAH